MHCAINCSCPLLVGCSTSGVSDASTALPWVAGNRDLQPKKRTSGWPVVTAWLHWWQAGGA